MSSTTRTVLSSQANQNVALPATVVLACRDVAGLGQEARVISSVQIAVVDGGMSLACGACGTKADFGDETEVMSCLRLFIRMHHDCQPPGTSDMTGD